MGNSGKDSLREEIRAIVAAGKSLDAAGMKEIAQRFGVTEGRVRGLMGSLKRWYAKPAAVVLTSLSEDQPIGFCAWCGKYGLYVTDCETLVCIDCASVFTRMPYP